LRFILVQREQRTNNGPNRYPIGRNQLITTCWAQSRTNRIGHGLAGIDVRN
jgi:hypothetical protein